MDWEFLDPRKKRKTFSLMMPLVGNVMEENSHIKISGSVVMVPTYVESTI
jgi:hypothetical protein